MSSKSAFRVFSQGLANIEFLASTARQSLKGTSDRVDAKLSSQFWKEGLWFPLEPSHHLGTVIENTYSN